MHEKVYLHDDTVLISRYDTPRFAPLRALLDRLISSNQACGWSAKHHVALPFGGPGEPPVTIWVKKNAPHAAHDVSEADLRFRFDSGVSSAGFGFDALRTKLGFVRCADVGLEWLVVRSDPLVRLRDEDDEDGEEALRRQFVVAVRDDDGFAVELWLYLADMHKPHGASNTWGRLPICGPPSTGTHTDDMPEVFEEEEAAVEAASDPELPMEAAKRALDELDAAVASATDVAKRLRALLG